MADKPEFVDMISEATRQSRRRIHAAHRRSGSGVASKETSRLSHWPPEHWNSGGWRR